MASQSQDSANVGNGNLSPSSTWGEYNNIIFAVGQALKKMQTSTIVQVVRCTNAGGLAPVGFVDIIPMINQIDAAGNPTPHVTIYNVPYLRLQGGLNAIIIDPVAGDIGIANFASRDISKIKSTKRRGNPGSLRTYSFSDAMYMGGILNGQPTQYVQFSGAGVKIASNVKVLITAPNVEVNSTGNALVTASGTATVTATGAINVNSSATVSVTAPTINLN